MRSLFDLSFGLIMPDGTWFGLRVKRETRTTGADRNLDTVLDRET